VSNRPIAPCEVEVESGLELKSHRDFENKSLENGLQELLVYETCWLKTFLTSFSARCFVGSREGRGAAFVSKHIARQFALFPIHKTKKPSVHSVKKKRTGIWHTY